MKVWHGELQRTEYRVGTISHMPTNSSMLLIFLMLAKLYETLMNPAALTSTSDFELLRSESCVVVRTVLMPNSRRAETTQKHDSSSAF